jgi:hypothetical protein
MSGKRALALFITTTIGSSSLAIAGELVGRWRDNPGSYWDGTIEIVRDGGKFYRVLGDHRWELAEFKTADGKRAFRKLGDDDIGDFYVLEPGGTLGLYDNDGFIRRATPLK